MILLGVAVKAASTGKVAAVWRRLFVMAGTILTQIRDIISEQFVSQKQDLRLPICSAKAAAEVIASQTLQS